MREVIICGGGLAGLSAAMMLARAGVDVLVIEKEQYAFHKVCGEYVSNEVLPYLHQLGVEVEALSPAHISRLQLSATSGKMLEQPLDLGGFGVSRYRLDHHLYEHAQSLGAKFMTGEKVRELEFREDHSSVQTSGEDLQARVVIGSFGKRTNLDRTLERPFLQQRSPWMGIKYHVRLDFPSDLIALHNFPGGYCGINPIEEEKLCLCYLVRRELVRTHKGISGLEEHVLSQNPHLRRIFAQAEHLYERPLVINEISFEKKDLVHRHVLMAGDAAGMIAPLCGNGMAMALHGGKLAAQQVLDFLKGSISRREMEQNYTRTWNRQFAGRLWRGRQVQHLFGRRALSEVAVGAANLFPPFAQGLIRQSHGEEFGV